MVDRLPGKNAAAGHLLWLLDIEGNHFGDAECDLRGLVSYLPDGNPNSAR